MTSSPTSTEIEVVVTPHDNDVLSGRGGNVNSHPGNKRFRDYVFAQRNLYAATPRNRKPAFAKLIVNTIRNLDPPGRFLMQDKETKLWYDIGDKMAWKKTRQALREKISTLTNSMDAQPGGSTLMSNNTQKAELSSSSTAELREMLVRQLLVNAFDQGNPPENGISSNKKETNPDSSMHDHFEKVLPLRKSLIDKFIPMNRTPMIPENDDSIGTFSNTGLSFMTDRTTRTSISNITGVSFATRSSNGTASCSSGFGTTKPNWNRINLDGIPGGNRTEMASNFQSKVAAIAKRRNPDRNKHKNSLSLEGLDPPSFGDHEISGLISTSNTNEKNGLSISDGTSSASKLLNSNNLDSLQRKSSSISPDIGEGKEDKDSFRSELSKRLNYDNVKSDRTLSISRKKLYTGTSLHSILLASLSADGSKQLSIGTLKSDEAMSLRSRSRPSITSVLSIIMLSLSTLDPDEDDPSSSFEELKQRSNGSNELISILSKRNSSFSEIMSVCESMSTTDSGLFSMDEHELEKWENDVMDWEMEAEKEDIELVREELLQIEENEEEVDNLIEMSSIMSDTCLW